MIRFEMHEDIAKDAVIVDGVARSGKTMLSGIVSSLEGFEHVQYYDLIEHILVGYALGQIKESYAKALSRMLLNELAYNTQLSRGTNFRRDDFSSVLRSTQPEIYQARLSRPDGDEIVNELRSKPSPLTLLTHDIFVNLDAFQRLDVGARILEIFRHPVDMAYSWWEKGWGGRFGEDPRAFTLTIPFKGTQLPWYALGHEQAWMDSNPMERCVLIACDLQERAAAQYSRCVDRSKLHILTFEDFVTRPDEELEKICAFLKCRRSDHTKRFLREARCPRVLDPSERKKKRSKMEASLRPERAKQLKEAVAKYEKNLYGLRK